MQQAVPVGQGAMAALLGLEPAAVREIAATAAEGEVCEAANDNAPGQIVVSGTRTAVERAVEIAKARGARAMMLPVSAPFHCALMQPAADAMRYALGKVKVSPPKVPLVPNVSANPVNDPAEIVNGLVAQVTGTVRWRECVLYLVNHGVDRLVEVGSGKVLTGLAKRIAKDTAAVSIATPEDVAAFKV
jgi:[acyl-carrier-protein] S-malonyltransferase